MTDAPRCGNCRHWEHDGLTMLLHRRRCLYVVDYSQLPHCLTGERVFVGADEGTNCKCHTPKEPDK